MNARAPTPLELGFESQRARSANFGAYPSVRPSQYADSRGRQVAPVFAADPYRAPRREYIGRTLLG